MDISTLRRNLHRSAVITLALGFAAAATSSPARAVATPRPSATPVLPAAALNVAVAGALSAIIPAVVAGAPVAVAPVRTPAMPTGLPTAIEVASSYVGQTSCEPVSKPGAVALGQLLKATYPDTSYGVARACQVYMNSEHYDGRAVDWMNSIRNPSQSAQAAALITWLLKTDAQGHPFANAKRLGVMYMIWNNKIWESYRPSAGWQPYNNCARTPSPSLDSSCHRNHIHFSLSWAGAMKRTSFWTKKVAAQDYGPCRTAELNFAAPYSRANPRPCPRYAKVSAPAGSSAVLANLYKFSGAYLKPGSSGPGVTAVQKALNVSPTGNFGPLTTTAVLKVKANYKLGKNPLMDGVTWKVLLRYVAASQTRPSTPGPAGNPLTPYRQTVIKYGSKGAAVSALQRRLRVTPVSGWFGPNTRTAVISWQKYMKQTPNGVVDAKTWIALGA